MGLSHNLWIHTIYTFIVNLENRKNTRLLKNYSYVDGKIFVIKYPCQSEQDNVMISKSFVKKCL